MAQVPHADEGPICPLHKVDVSTVCHKCPWWCRLIGKNPQTEEMIDDWRCAVAMLPMLMVDNTQQARQTGAALESLRNNVVRGVSEAIGNGRLLDARNDTH